MVVAKVEIRVKSIRWGEEEIPGETAAHGSNSNRPWIRWKVRLSEEYIFCYLK